MEETERRRLLANVQPCSPQPHTWHSHGLELEAAPADAMSLPLRVPHVSRIVSLRSLWRRLCSRTCRCARPKTDRHRQRHSVRGPCSDAHFSPDATACVSCPRDWGCLDTYFMGFESEARGSRRNKQQSPLLPAAANPLSKGGAQPSFQPSDSGKGK